MDIVVTTSMANVTGFTLSQANGMTADSSIIAAFTLTNASLTMPGWSILVDISANVGVNASLVDGNLTLSMTPAGFQVEVTELSSNVGTLTTEGFKLLTELAIAGTVHPPYLFSFPTPSYFTLSSPFVSINNGYGDLGANIEYSSSPNVISCGGGQVCPEQNTCCQWGSSGDWGCCILPNAVCCPTGCCVQDSSCSDEYCLGAN